MKLKIKIKVDDIGCMPEILSKGDFIDLKVANQVYIDKGALSIVSLGVAMELPKGMIAKVVSRSSTPKKFNVIVANSIGVIDNSYKGNNDVWKAQLYALDYADIPPYTRICQFEIVPSQFATIWQKIKWLLSSGVKFEKVDSLISNSRGGLGSTGI